MKVRGTIDKAKLREIAKAATPGPWWLCEDDGGICAGPEGLDSIQVGPTDFNAANTDFVLAANPQTVLELLDEIERLRRDRDSYANSDFERQLDDSREQLAAANAEIERLRGAVQTQANDAGAIKDDLIAMTAARDEACDIAERCTIAPKLPIVCGPGHAAPTHETHTVVLDSAAVFKRITRIDELRKVGGP